MDSQGAKQGGRPPSLDVCEPSDPHLDAIRFVKFLSGRLLRPEVGPKTERAAWLLLLLSRQPAHTSILLKCCAVEALVEVVQRLPPPWDQQSPGPGALPGEPWVAASASPQANVVEYATGALAQLAQRDYACRASISESGAVESLVLLLAEGPDCVAAENAVMVLHCLAASTPAMRDEVREAGGIPALVDLLQEAPLAHNVVLTRSIFWALICLADQHPLNQAAIWDAGGCRALLSIMQGGSFLNPQAREASGILALALRCFSVLMQDSSDTQFAVHRMGVVPQVVRLLQSCVATLGMTAEELEASWRRSVAALVGAWALLMEVHRRVAEAADGKRMLPRGTGDTALGIWTAIIEEEEEGSGEEEGGEGYPDPPLSLREEEGVAGEWEVCDEALEGILEEFGPPEEAQDVYPELPDETAELPAKMMRLDEEIGESLELKRNVWEAWRSIPMELMMRVVPGSGRRLHPAREALRSLRALVTSCKSGPAQAKEAGALPLLVEALRLQLDAGRALSEFALEPAEVISAIVAGSPAAKEELRKAGGVELLVRMLPLPQDESSLETELEEVEQDDLIRFWWDRIMWSENGDAEEVKADFPFFACRLTTAALDTVMSGCPSNTEAAMSAGAMRPLVQLLHNAVSCRRHQVVLSTTGALASLLDGNAEAQRDFIIRRGIAPLMSLLRIPLDPSMVPFQLWLQLQAKAALCVQRLVEDFPMGQRRVRQAGALPCLLSLLEEVLSKGQQQEGSGKEQEDAALESALWAINNLTANNQDNQEALRRAMGIPALVAVLRNPGLGALTVSGAIWSVSQLALGSSVAQVELAECGVVPALMEVARRQPVGDNSLCEGVARAVGALANNCYANQELLRIEGAVSLMVEMLQVGQDTVTAECAAQSLAALCWSNPGNQQLMGDIGGLRMLIEQLMAGPHSLLSRGASLALAAAMGDNFRNQNIVRDAGGAFVLVDMLRSGPSNPVVIPVLHALGLLVKGHRAAQSEVGEAGGTSALLKLLQSSPGSDVAREAVASLSALTRDHPGNKAAVQRDGGVAILLGFVIAGCQALASRSIALPGAWDKPDPLGALAPFEPDADLPTQLGVVEYSAKTLANLVTGNAAAKVELMECDGVAALIQLQSLAIKAREHWPEGRGWLNAVSGESAAALAALCAGCPETKAEIRDNGGMEALVRGLKIGEDKDAAVEEAACVMRCLIAPAHAFWDGAMSSIIQRKRERSTALQASVTQFYRAEHSMFEQHQALEAMLEVNTDRKAKSQYIWALLHLIADCEENRKELAELYAVGIAPLKLKMEEIAGKTAPASTDLTRRVRSLIGRYCRAAPAAGK